MAEFSVTMPDIESNGTLTQRLLDLLAAGHEPTTGQTSYLHIAAIELHRLRTAVAALEIRQHELLATIVRVTNEMPFPDEIKGWTGQRAKMVAEIGTLKARVAELESAIAADKERVRAVVIDAAEFVLVSDIHVRVGNMDSTRLASVIAARVADQLTGTTLQPAPSQVLTDSERDDAHKLLRLAGEEP